ncbi:VanZ family protein [Neobacillus sp. PS2-9]|uniref:VanZ family protein n=1 Tax=Neobacillus sp. PS2-9 TaxID=3070676 RepID=UPI0027E18EDA|nr:VanZ family protein [Neobacillus sp. PS2-9]WML58559.1 VanZ family protein [Neobacillus sp. PS2-9]
MDQNIKNYVNQIVKELQCDKNEKAEIAEEMIQHLELLKDEYIEQGLSESEAVQQALASFGDKNTLTEGLQSSMFPGYKIYSVGVKIAFYLYSFIVLWNLLFQRIIGRIIDHGSFNRYFWYPESTHSFFNLEVWKLNANLIPFKTISRYIIEREHYNVDIILHNTVGNIMIFVPLGILLPILFKKYHSFAKLLISVVGMTCVIEIGQFFLQIGQFDIDDVILNVSGALIGFAFFKGLTVISKQTKWKFLKRIIAL